MVNVEVKRQNGTIAEVCIHGHAGYAKHGQDLVCAGVSSISVGMLNALDQLTEHDVCDLVIEEAYIRIKLNKRDQNAELLINTLVIQLKTLEENYHKYISICDQEV